MKLPVVVVPLEAAQVGLAGPGPLAVQQLASPDEAVGFHGVVDEVHAGDVVRPAEPNQILEGVETALPGDEPAAQILHVQVVLQRRLEVVRRHQLGQVEGLGCIGQRAQAHNPHVVLLDFLAHQGLEEVARADAARGGIDLLQLLAEGIERLAIKECRTPVNL